MKKVIVVILCVIVVGVGSLIGINLIPRDSSVGTVVGNAIDNAIDDALNTYESASGAIETVSISMAGAYETAKTAVLNSVDVAADFLGGILCDAGNWLKKDAE